MYKIGALGLTFTIRLSASYDIFAIETLAACQLLERTHNLWDKPYQICEIVPEHNMRCMTEYPFKEFLPKDAAKDWLNQFDLLVLPAQYFPDEQTSKLPMTKQMLELLPHYKGELVAFKQDAREKFSHWMTEAVLQDLAPQADVSVWCPAHYPVQWTGALLRNMPGPYIQKASQKPNIDYGCVFGNFQASPDRLRVLKQYAPRSTFMIGRQLDMFPSITNGEMVSSAKLKELSMASATTVIHIEPCLLDEGAWFTSRIAQALAWGLHMLIPKEYAWAFRKFGFSDEFLTYMYVRDAEESIACMRGFKRSDAFREHILSLNWQEYKRLAWNK